MYVCMNDHHWLCVSIILIVSLVSLFSDWLLVCISALWLAACISTLWLAACVYISSDWLRGRWWRTRGQTSPWPSDSSARRQCSSFTAVASLRSSITFSRLPVSLPVFLTHQTLLTYKKSQNVALFLLNLPNCHYCASRDFDASSLSVGDMGSSWPLVPPAVLWLVEVVPAQAGQVSKTTSCLFSTLHLFLKRIV